MTIPEPAVSPAPDTDALREQVADKERVDGIRNDALTDAANAVFEALGGYPGPEIVTFHEALAAVRTRSAEWERRGEDLLAASHTIAGLRADLDRLTAEMLMVPRANDTVITMVVEAVLAAGDWNGGVDAARQVFRQRAQLARSAGARTIPDDAAEQVLNLVRTGFTRGGQLDAVRELIDGWRGDSTTDALAHLGATPTTGPAPAPEQTNPSQVELSGSVPQRFQATDEQTNAGRSDDYNDDLIPDRRHVPSPPSRAHAHGEVPDATR